MPAKDSVDTELRGIFVALKKKLPGADQRLLRLLHDPDAETRLSVVKAIHEKKWTAFAGRLAARLDEETDEAVRAALTAACAELGTVAS